MSEQKSTILYAHGSAYNHGCEAIVRATVDLLDLQKEKTILFSNRIEGDLAFHIDDIVTVKAVHETPDAHNSIRGIFYRICAHTRRDSEKYYYRYFGKNQYRYLYKDGEIALSIGGDNYCYESALAGLSVRNYWLNKKGVKTILWGASLSEELMDANLVEDLNRYALIVARENNTLELLKKNRIKAQCVCGPDPAFSLKARETAWPDNRPHDNVVGINISPFVIQAGEEENGAFRNYVELVDWLLKETDNEIALIPHVVFPDDKGANDIVIAQKLLKHYSESERVFLVSEPLDCCELKSLISKCSLFVGARTHATIAAYSTCVPTIVVGYSSKSIGIARDLFGTEEGYVCSVGRMNEDDEMLLRAFKRMLAEREREKAFLQERIPEYIQGLALCSAAANEFIR